MRLINTTTLEVREFYSEQTPQYAILSHCWGEDEVSYVDYVSGPELDTEGFEKIEQCCRLARELDLEWVGQAHLAKVF